MPYGRVVWIYVATTGSCEHLIKLRKINTAAVLAHIIVTQDVKSTLFPISHRPPVACVHPRRLHYRSTPPGRMAASNLGLLSLAPSSVSTQNVALKENIVYAARGEIETTARLLSQVKTLQEHVNPPYLRGDYCCRLDDRVWKHHTRACCCLSLVLVMRQGSTYHEWREKRAH